MSETVTTLVSGAMNFRDTGGLPAGDGVTRAGVLYRSGNLANVDETGAEALRELGLRRIIDLRDDEEVTFSPSRLDGVDAVTQRVPLFLGSVRSFFENDIDLSGLYDHLIDEASENIVDVVRGIIAEQPVLVHCTVGKDRTGVTVALTLAAAGVDREAVIADYARTETLLPAERNEMIVARIREAHPNAKHAVDLATRSPAPVMRALLERIDAQWGSPAEYLAAHGVSDDELARLRSILIQPKA
jgi:protein-tyrosine phosphatase